MSDHDVEFCSFQELSMTVITWNVGAATPTHLRGDSNDTEAFASMLAANSAAHLLVFGFQELVDLEDKKLTASKSRAISTHVTGSLPHRDAFQGVKKERSIRARKPQPSVSGLEGLSGQIVRGHVTPRLLLPPCPYFEPGGSFHVHLHQSFVKGPTWFS